MTDKKKNKLSFPKETIQRLTDLQAVQGGGGTPRKTGACIDPVPLPW